MVYPSFLNVSNTSLNTTISNEFGVKVSTIEHLMGALFSIGIDNALIEIDNEEVPILDGSAKEFVEKFLATDFVVSNKPIKIIKINKKVEFKDGKRYASIEPSKLSLDIEFELKYNNEVIGNQKNKINVYNDELKDIINSRTFCLYEDIEEIKKIGLAKGGSLDNAIVVKGSDILNINSKNKPIMSGGEHAWDMITMHDQATSSGLYLFTVENKNTGEFKEGKFLIIK